MKVFLKKDDLQLINGGYVSNKDSKPVANFDFITAQQHAAFIMEFAKAAQGKDFIGKKADNLDSFLKEMQVKFKSKKVIDHVKDPKQSSMPMQNKLAQEALSFIDFNEKSDKVTKVNEFLSKFDVIHEFETFGLFFDDDEIVKLDKIYTMKDIIKAVTSVIDLLG